MSLRKHAIYLAECGYRVFPITPGGTVPAVKFSTESTDDPSRVKKIWRSDKSRKNIGIHTGDGLMVLDLDVQSGGDQSILPLLHKHGPLPDTFAVTTPSGGMHFYFETTKDIRNSAGKIAQGIDIRGHNGFVVAPGSYREEKVKADGTIKLGGKYEAINDLPPANCPEWLEKRCLTGAEPNSTTGGVANDQPLEDVPLGARNDRLFKEACGLRGKGWNAEAILQAIIARNNTFSQPLKESEIRLIASQSAKYSPNAGSGTYDATAQVKAQQQQQQSTQVSSDEESEHIVKPLNVTRSENLYKMDLPPLNYCIEPMMAEGMYLLNGRPKGGKSWLAMELAVAVAKGEKLWDEFDTHQGEVLYLALEDGHRRLKDRLKLFGNPPGLDLVTKGVELIDTGLLQQLQWWLDVQERPQLIVIDILQQIMGESNGGENAYKFDYRMAKQLQSWAIDNRICLFVVHHTRKMVTDHDMDSVSGSQGLGGAADGVWFLKSPNNGKTGSLTMFSRDTDNGQYDLCRADKPSGRWEFVGAHDDQDDMPTDTRIVAELQAGGAVGVSALATALGSARSHVQQTVSRMYKEGRLDRVKDGVAFIYSLPVPVSTLPK